MVEYRFIEVNGLNCVPHSTSWTSALARAKAFEKCGLRSNIISTNDWEQLKTKNEIKTLIIYLNEGNCSKWEVK